MVAGLVVDEAVVKYQGATGEVKAVDRASLSLLPGEVVAIMGASGSGKSSLLRGIAGLEPLSAGSVAWDGQDLTKVPTYLRGFGMLFQDAQLFQHMSVGANIGYGLTSMPSQSRKQRVEELLELVDLPGFARRRPHELSGGQAQRVALARALAPKPRLLLLDEPLSALDRQLREHLVGVLKRTLDATGTTAIYVTHDHDEAFALGDRVAVMRDGRILQIDTPERLWSQPASEEVARFLGYGPFISAAVAAQLLGEGQQISDRVPSSWAIEPKLRTLGGGSTSGEADDVVVALGPGSLVQDPDGVLVQVVETIQRRGHVEASVILPNGLSGVVSVIRDPRTSPATLPDSVRVRLNLDKCALLHPRSQPE